MRLLSDKARRFIELVAIGEDDQGDCYMKAGYDSSRQAAIANSSRMLAKPEAQAYLAELRERSSGENVLCLVQRREILRSIATDPEQPAAARVSALTLDSRLAGDLTERPMVQVATVNITQLLESDGEEDRSQAWGAWSDAEDAIEA